MEKIRVQKPSLWLKTKSISKQEDDNFQDKEIISGASSGETDNDIKNDDSQVEIDENNIVFKVIHTNMPDVYNIYIFN